MVSQSLFSHSGNLSDYIIILQKLSQAEPHAILASLLPATSTFLNEVAAAGSVQGLQSGIDLSAQEKMERQFISQNIKSILKNIDAGGGSAAT